MSRMLQFTTLITILCIFAIGVTTHTASAPSPSPDRTTVVGCLTSTNSQVSLGKSGGQTPVPTFTITNAGTGTNGMVATSGTTSTSNPDSAVYRLDVTTFLHKSSGDFDMLYPTDYKRLNPDLGHKVQIVGTVRAQKNGIASDVGSTRSTHELPELKVESIKVLSSTCTP